MELQIKQIILWPRDPSRRPRVVPFAPGQVNVISGASRTGKSAIIPIIDYCLGSEKCTIPVKTVRDRCAWFGIVFNTSEGEKLLARREPGGLKATTGMFLMEGKKIEVPDKIDAKNTTSEAVKRMLDRMAELTGIDFDVDQTGSGFKGRPSFRDLMAFVCQPQNIIANPDVLFYKADTYEHREKLRTIFPYVLNAITPGLMAKQHELAELRKELRRKRNELENVRKVSERWVAEIRAHIAQARELGLVKEVIPSDAGYEQLVDVLRRMVTTAGSDSTVTEESVEEAITELMQLRKEEGDHSLRVSTLKNRLAQMAALKDSTKDYKDSLFVQRDRLKISEWLGTIRDPDHSCPICGSSFNSTADELDRLKNSLREIEKEAGEFQTIPPAFDRELERVRSELRLATESLEAVKMRIRGLQVTSEKAKERQYSSMRVSRFLGTIEQALSTYDMIGTDASLVTDVADLEARTRDLEKEISEAGVRDRTNRAVRIVNTNASILLPSLDCESPNDPVSLSINDLTVAIEGPNRTDYLWEIGSGSNWLSYHVALSLALQQFFLSIQRSPVPSFIVYDQPSQVYFPKRLVPASGDTDVDPTFTDEDVQAVRKVFKVLSHVVGASQGKLQVIVLDHASEDVWGKINHVHLVEEWRGGKALIPDAWLT